MTPARAAAAGPQLDDAEIYADSVRAAALLHGEHERQATVSQRFAERLTAFIARPRFIVFIVLVAAAWAGYNAVSFARHVPSFDPPPCPWLQGLISLCALATAILILGTQRRAAGLAEQRAALTLEVALLAERKTAKLIELLEELRRDHPEIADRHDSEARLMARSADPEALLDAINDSHAEIVVER